MTRDKPVKNYRNRKRIKDKEQDLKSSFDYYIVYFFSSRKQFLYISFFYIHNNVNIFHRNNNKRYFAL